MSTPALPPSALVETAPPVAPAPRAPSDAPFLIALGALGGAYVLIIVLMLVADLFYTTPGEFWAALRKEEIRYAIRLTLLSCTLTAVLSLWVAVPLGYLLSRFSFPGKGVVEAILDIPIILPPLVVGLSLLILFQFWPFSASSRWVVYEVPGVVVAQFTVAAAFAVRTMRQAFDQLDVRREQVAWTLGCTRAQAFWMVVWPETRRGRWGAATLAWARALGEFGPLLIFAGATRNKTEVLSTTVYLEFSVGNIEAAVAVSLLMVLAAVAALLAARKWGLRDVM